MAIRVTYDSKGNVTSSTIISSTPQKTSSSSTPTTTTKRNVYEINGIKYYTENGLIIGAVDTISGVSYGQEGAQRLSKGLDSGFKVTARGSGSGSTPFSEIPLSTSIDISKTKDLGKGTRLDEATGTKIKVTDINAGQQAYSISKSTPLSKFIATYGREGLPFAQSTTQPIYDEKGKKIGEKSGTIGYDKRNYTKFEIYPSALEKRNQSKEYAQKFTSSSPYGNSKSFIAEIIPQNEERIETTQPMKNNEKLPRPTSPYGYSFYDRKTGEYGYVEFKEQEKNYAVWEENKNKRLKINNYYLKSGAVAVGFGTIPITFATGKVTGIFYDVPKAVLNPKEFLESGKQFLSESWSQGKSFITGKGLPAAEKFGSYILKNPESAVFKVPFELGRGTAVSEVLTVKPFKAVKVSFEIAKGTYVPKMVGEPKFMSMKVESDLSIQTKARTMDNLQMGTQPKITINYEQEFKNPYFGKRTVPIKVEQYPEKTVTSFSADKVNYEMTKRPELQKTTIYKEYPNRPNVEFTKKIPSSELDIQMTNQKSTVPFNAEYKPSNSMLVKLTGKEVLFDIEGKYKGKKVTGFGKTQLAGIQKSKADFSKKLYVKTTFEEIGNVIKDSERIRPITENGTILSSGLKETKVLSRELVRPITVEETHLYSGSPKYWNDVKTKNFGVKTLKINQIKDIAIEPKFTLLSKNKAQVSIGNYDKEIEIDYLKPKKKYEDILSIYEYGSKKIKLFMYNIDSFSNRPFSTARKTALHEVGHDLDISLGAGEKFSGLKLSQKENQYFQRKRKEKISDGYSEVVVPFELKADIFKDLLYNKAKAEKYFPTMAKVGKEFLKEKGFHSGETTQIIETKSQVGKTTIKGQVATTVDIFSKTDIVFGTEEKLVNMGFKGIPQAEGIRVPEINRFTQTPKTESFEWLEGRPKNEVDLFEEKLGKFKNEMTSKGIKGNELNKVVSEYSLKNHPTQKTQTINAAQLETPKISSSIPIMGSMAKTKTTSQYIPMELAEKSRELSSVNPQYDYIISMKSLRMAKTKARLNINPKSETKLFNSNVMSEISRGSLRNNVKLNSEMKLNQENKLNIELRTNLRQNQRIEQKQEQRLQQKQFQRITQKTKLFNQFEIIRPPSPTIKIKPFKPNLTTPKTSILKSFNLKSFKQPKKYTPSGFSALFGIKGKDRGTSTGLSFRPIK